MAETVREPMIDRQAAAGPGASAAFLKRKSYLATLAVGGLVGAACFWGYQRYISSPPYIGCDFSDRAEADLRRDFGALNKDLVLQACKKAVDNYFSGQGPQNMSVSLPSREELRRHGAWALPDAAPLN